MNRDSRGAKQLQVQCMKSYEQALLSNKERPLIPESKIPYTMVVTKATTTCPYNTFGRLNPNPYIYKSEIYKNKK